MKYIIGKDRNQFEMFCLEERIPQENEVRLIDLFVDSLPLEKVRFCGGKEKSPWWKTCLSPKHTIEAIYLRLHEQNSLLQAIREGMLS